MRGEIESKFESRQESTTALSGTSLDTKSFRSKSGPYATRIFNPQYTTATAMTTHAASRTVSTGESRIGLLSFAHPSGTCVIPSQPRNLGRPGLSNCEETSLASWANEGSSSAHMALAPTSSIDPNVATIDPAEFTQPRREGSGLGS